MTSIEIRQIFLDFFKSKDHKVVSSAPIVLKDDPTLMFTNAGMNQFKNVFLANSKPIANRVVNTQKCLRVSGKHNDLEEVGLDTYHHTMFEMLGNWSFGDYFKEDAIDWAWELLTGVYKIEKDRLYVTVFGGDEQANLKIDREALECWEKHIHKDRILPFDKNDNFWEMGDTGPCGPCSEIHVDIRNEKERKKMDGSRLVNTGHPEVLELWNLVFIQYNRLQNGSLESLPNRHVDTGMGFERLCMILQGKHSNYDSDLFRPMISLIEKECNIKYGRDNKKDIAIRVLVDHVRAVAFSISDGQLPFRDGAGYVIRRILRRAVRYGYHHIGIKEPFIYKLVSVLAKQMDPVFPEIALQQTTIEKVIREEERSFLKTLELGLKRIGEICKALSKETKDKDLIINGKQVFELYDTYGFPADLTSLVASENGFKIDLQGFELEMEQQRNRSQKASEVETSDWVMLLESNESVFVGYKQLETSSKVVKYRTIKAKNKEKYQVVLDKTPFYAESGGQVGDKGVLVFGSQTVKVVDTQKENELVVHIVDKLPRKLTTEVTARVDPQKRLFTTNNHSATHLFHAALKKILGDHVEQKGSLVDHNHLRFDFTHFSKIEPDELDAVESLVNNKIRENIPVDIHSNLAIGDALKMGATALFGEKYGEKVRVVSFDKDFSIELCGGTHVSATGQIGICKILSESAVAAGIRRIEAVCGTKAEDFINTELASLKEIRQQLKNPKSVVEGVKQLQSENEEMKKELGILINQQVGVLKNELKASAEKINGIFFIGEIVNINEVGIKNLAFELRKEMDNLFLVIGSRRKDKAGLTVMVSENLIKKKHLHAGNMIRELAKEIDGGGGGQPFYASAGGKNVKGLQTAIDKARELVLGL